MVGTFRVVRGAWLAVQVVCTGGGPVTVTSLFEIGPCALGKLSTSVSMMARSRLVVNVRASPKVAWSLYATQPENRAAARRLIGGTAATCGPGLGKFCGRNFFPTSGGPQQA